MLVTVCAACMWLCKCSKVKVHLLEEVLMKKELYVHLSDSSVKFSNQTPMMIPSVAFRD